MRSDQPQTLNEPMGLRGAPEAPVLSRLRCSVLEVQVVAAAIVSLVLLTTGLAIAESWYDEQRGAVVVLISLLAIVSLVIRSAPPTTATLALLAVALFGIVGVSLAARPLLAAIEWAGWMLFASILLLVPPTRRRSIARAASCFALIVGGGYVFAVVSRYVSAVVVGFPVGADTLLVGIANPRFAAHLQMLSLPFFPVAFVLCSSRPRRFTVATIAVLWWMCLIGSGSRTGWLAVSAGLLAATACGIEGRRLAGLSAVWAAAGALVYYIAFFTIPAWAGFPTLPETGRLSEFASAGTRGALWEAALRMALEHPVFGTGPMHFAYTYNVIAAHPHNFWLQVAAEWGVAVALAVIGATAWLLAKAYASACRSSPAPEPDGGIAVAVFAASIVWVTGIQLDGLMVVPLSQLTSLVVLMCAVALVRSAPPLAGRTAGSWTLGALIVVAIGILSTLLLVPFGDAARRERDWRMEHPAELLLPRFWQQGWIGPDQDPSAR